MTTTPAAGQPLRIEDHIGWARRIAKKVCKRHRITGFQELDDVHQTGLMEMCRIAPGFNANIDPARKIDTIDGAFRGWAYLFVKKACEREAERMINAGTYRSRRQVAGAPLIIGVPRSEITTPSGEQIEEVSTRDTAVNPWDFLSSSVGKPGMVTPFRPKLATIAA